MTELLPPLPMLLHGERGGVRGGSQASVWGGSESELYALETADAMGLPTPTSLGPKREGVWGNVFPQAGLGGSPTTLPRSCPCA